MKIDIGQNFADGKDIYFDAASNEFKKFSDLDAGVAAVAKKVFAVSTDPAIQERFLSEIDTAFAGGNRRWIRFSQKLVERLESLENPKAKLTIAKIKKAQADYIEQNSSLERICPDFLERNRHYIRNSIIENPESIEYIPDEIYKDDEELYLLSLKHLDLENTRCSPFIKINPEKLKDREFAKKACALNGLALKYFPNFQNDPEIATLALKQNGLAYQFLETPFILADYDKAKYLRFKEEFINLALSSNGMSLLYMPLDIANDTNYAAKAAKTGPGILRYAGRHNIRDIVLRCCCENAQSLLYANAEFLSDPEVILAAYKQNPLWTQEFLRRKGVTEEAIGNFQKDALASFSDKPRLVEETTGYKNESIKNSILSALFEAERKNTASLLPNITSNSDIAPALSSIIFLSLLPKAETAAELASIQNLNKELLEYVNKHKVAFKDAMKLKTLLLFLTNVKKLPLEDNEKIQLIKQFMNKELSLPETLEMMNLFPLALEQPGVEVLKTIRPLTKESLLNSITLNLIDQGFLDPSLKEKFENTFLKSRMPSAIFSYSSYFNLDPVMKDEIKHFISLVCNDDLDDWRLTANSHSSYMKENQQSKWNICLPKREFNQCSFQNLEFSPYEFIVSKIIPAGSDEGLIESDKISRALKGPVADLSPLETKITNFAKANFETREAMLEAIITDLKASHPASQLLTVFESLKKSKPLIVTDSDNWQDLFFCGSEVMGSCQNVVGNPNLNKCLLGYVLDGKTRVLCVKETEDGPIKARALLKVFIEKKTDPATGVESEAPCLMFEKPYPKITPLLHKQLIEAAKTKAELMGVDLYEASTDGVTLYSKGVHAPYEYEDGALEAGPEGHRTNGVFSITGKIVT